MMKPVKHIYPATLGFDKPTGRYYVLWPDLPGCTTIGDTEEDAVKNAREAMSLHLWSMEDDGDEIPSPSNIMSIKHKKNEAVVLLEVWMPSFREKMETKAVNRTVTLPKWLDTEAKTAELNYSQILQDGIMQRLNISRVVVNQAQRTSASPVIKPS